MLFSELKLKEASLQAVAKLGFESPTEIQEKSIPILLQDNIDFIGQAQTGTGKTAAFTLPLLEKLDLKDNSIQAIILAPTRELANQICEEIKKLSSVEQVKTMSIYGGTSVSGQLRDLRRIRPQILVGTPGRTLDFIRRKAINLAKAKFVILDEADEMLDMGFFDDVNEIVATVEEKNTWMFSATMPAPILKMINKQFQDPQIVKVTKRVLTTTQVLQQYCVVRSRSHGEALCRYLDYYQNSYAIVFTRTKVMAKQMTDMLNERGYEADSLHGDMSQDQRDLTMKKFKNKKVSLLICTDVAARGIDVDNLTHVINFGLPQDNEAYVHRIGRTGRGTSEGIALSIVDPNEQRRLRDIERITQAKIERVELPTVEQIVEVLAKKSFDRFEKALEKTPSDDASYKKFLEKFQDCSKEEILNATYSFAFEDNLKRYQNARALDTGKDSGSRERGPRGAQVGYERFFINVGRTQGMEPGGLIKLVSKEVGIQGAQIGKINIRDTFSFFEVPEQHKDDVMGMNSSKWQNLVLSLEVAKAETRSGGGGRRSGGNRGGGAGRSNGGRPRRSGGPSAPRTAGGGGSSERTRSFKR